MIVYRDWSDHVQAICMLENGATHVFADEAAAREFISLRSSSLTKANYQIAELEI